MYNINQLVSVTMITYNHDKYISDAIEGILLQKTTFPVELIIGEDCSTDNTRSICIEYQQKYPERIRLFLSDRNLGMLPNFVNTLNACKGKYTCICEGDDYWTDPYKLQTQVDFLEANPEYIACCHNVMVKNEIENNLYQMWPWEYDRDFTVEDIAEGNKISTLSIVFRNKKEIIEKLSAFIDKHPDTPVGDYVLNLFLAQKGKIRYFHNIMGIYRIHINSNHSSIVTNYQKYSDLLKKWINMLFNLMDYSDKNTVKHLKLQFLNKTDEVLFLDYKNKNTKEALRMSFILLKYIIYHDKSKIRLLFSIFYRTITSLFLVKK
ncbi:MAG TPA: glycosyltransferase [Bacteroidales bacterium]|nr:glycosyltransferase [Bacteroidales bacterium]